VFAQSRGYLPIAYLDETDISGFLSEALTADVESIFADETGFVGADSAVGEMLAVVLELCPILRCSLRSQGSRNW
jgi:hypothetical protein